MLKLPGLEELLKAGAHFGHSTTRRYPKMAPYIYTSRNDVHVIDLEKTLELMEQTGAAVKTMAAEGKTILFVGTKRQARAAVAEAAKSCGMPYLTERWIGGLLTNFPEMKKRLRKYEELRNQFATKEIERYTKKEQVTLKKKLETMDKYLSGLTNLKEMPDALYVASLHAEKTAVSEAQRTGVPVVAVADTNANPARAAYFIPANDDAAGAIKIMAQFIAAAVSAGKAEYEQAKAKAAAEKAKEEKKTVKVEHQAVKIAESV